MRKMAIMMMATVFFLAGTGLVLAEMHQQDEMQKPHPSEQQMQWFCPWCGSANNGGAGSGMGNHGMMQDNDMMQRGRCMHHGWSRDQCSKESLDKITPIGKEEARMLMNNYISGNPNLKVGDITEKDDSYVGGIVTKDGSLVENLTINKKTGWMKRTY